MKHYRVQFGLAFLMLLGGCDVLRVETLPSAELTCDPSLVGVWSEPESTDEFIVLTPDCATLYSVKPSQTATQVKAQAVDVIAHDVLGFSLGGAKFAALTLSEDEAPDPAASDPYDLGRVLVRYELSDDKLRVAFGDGKKAAQDVASGAAIGSVQSRRQDAQNASVRTLLTGSADEIAAQLQRNDYFAKLGDPLVRVTKKTQLRTVNALIAQHDAAQGADADKK
jgi:hypothetical protein